MIDVVLITIGLVEFALIIVGTIAAFAYWIRLMIEYRSYIRQQNKDAGDGDGDSGYVLDNPIERRIIKARVGGIRQGDGDAGGGQRSRTMETADKNKILAWHFVNDDLALNHDMKHLRVYPGLSLEVDADKLDLCNYGLHASIEPLDALKYAPGALVCHVQMSGRIIQDTDKLVASRRLVIWCADATRTLHEFTIWCAEQALVLIANPDHRSIEALRIKRLWLDGAATDAELDAARDAAWAAAYAAGVAAGAAAGAVAYAAGDAAYAAGAAARAAAYAAGAAAYAAGDAAYAAGDAVGAAAYAAGDATRAAQNKQLHHMLLALEKIRTAPAPDAGDCDGDESEGE